MPAAPTLYPQTRLLKREIPVRESHRRFTRRSAACQPPRHGRSMILVVGLALLALATPFVALSQANPLSFDDVASRAAAARSNGDLPQAIALYAQAVQLKSDWAEGWFYLGSLNYANSSYKEARDALTRLVAITPQAGPARAIRGLCDYEMGDYDEALSDLEIGLATGAANGSRNERIVRIYEAMLLTRAGRFEEALHAYGLLAKNGPAAPETVAAIGLAVLRNPVLPKDVPEDQRALTMAAGSAGFQLMTGEEKASSAAFDEFFHNFPKTLNIHYSYGYLLQQTDSEKAVIQFQSELALTPDNPLPAEMLAWSLLLEGNPRKALPYAQKADLEQPSSPIAQIVLGRSLAETGDISNGIEHLKRALELQPNNIEIHIALAEAYSRSGHPEEAWRERMASLDTSGSKPN